MRQLAGINVSRETLEKLERYAVELKKWNPKINLVSKSTLDDLWDRHFVDSAQIIDLAPNGITHWVDLGSGGGFPGLVIAIIFSEINPNVQFTLVESDQRKCAFLRNVIRETGISASVMSKRVEDIPSLSADVISARALADLTTLISLSKPHLAPGGVMLFPKGENWQSEVTQAQSQWRFDVDVAKSETNEKSVILSLSGVRRA